MRLTRALSIAVTLVTLTARPGAAQQGRPFTDAWFWGVKAGAVNYSTQVKNGATAPSVGGDWLITRSQGGLYLGFDQIFFNQLGYMPAVDTAGTTGLRQAQLKNMRQFEVAAMVFPGRNHSIRPYAGLGFVFNQIATVTPRGGYNSQADFDLGETFIQRFRASTSPLVLLGSQIRLETFSVFVQGSAAATQKEFFLSNLKPFHLAIEGGIRYNIGSSIEKM